MESFANGSINLCYSIIRNWHDKWRSLNLGPRTGYGLIEVNFQIEITIYIDI